MRAEEGDHPPVEFDMEGRAVEAFGIGADLFCKGPCLTRAAGEQERQKCPAFATVCSSGLAARLRSTVAASSWVTPSPPNSDAHGRQMHTFQPLGHEEAAEQRIGDHGPLDAHGGPAAVWEFRATGLRRSPAVERSGHHCARKSRKLISPPIKASPVKPPRKSRRSRYGHDRSSPRGAKCQACGEDKCCDSVATRAGTACCL